MKCFLDANIIFSASQPESPCGNLLGLLATKGELLTHVAVWDEAQRNLLAKRPQWAVGLSRLRATIELTTSLVPCPEVGLPEKDRPVLAAAIAGRATHLLTGDKSHFGPLYGQTFFGVFVLSPSMLARQLSESEKSSS